ncbi:MAG: HlyC/CorC family transporter [Verrucomicrobia bacterium]|nr:HlyC/CorC family transporter [Verrucomicrobiota bacterium]
MGPAEFLILGGVLAFAGASFFFALAESCLLVLGRWRARQLAEQDPTHGAMVMRLLEKPEELMATLGLGNALANGLVAVGVLWPTLARGWPLVPVLAGTLLFILAGCHVVPKTLAAGAPDRWAIRVAPWVGRVHDGTGWFQDRLRALNDWLLRRVLPRSATRSPTALADEEYRELLDLAYQQGALGQAEKEIILQIISLDRRTARDVMRPLSRMNLIPDDLSMEQMVEAARTYQRRRLPIYDETPDSIAGILNTRALLLNPDMDLEQAIEFPSFVPESMNLLQLLHSLQTQRRGLAIVLDEFGGTAGVVTLADILEAVVGRIRAEGEATGFVMEKLGEGRWRVNGTMGVEDFRREYPALGETPDVDTMGGLVVALMEVVPPEGASVVFRGLRLKAHAVDDRRVREVLVEVIGKK